MIGKKGSSKKTKNTNIQNTQNMQKDISNDPLNVAQEVVTTWITNKIREKLPKYLDSIWDTLTSKFQIVKKDADTELEELRPEIDLKILYVMNEFVNDVIANEYKVHAEQYDIGMRIGVVYGHNDYENTLTKELKDRNFPMNQIEEIIESVRNHLSYQFDLEKELESLKTTMNKNN